MDGKDERLSVGCQGTSEQTPIYRRSLEGENPAGYKSKCLPLGV